MREIAEIIGNRWCLNPNKVKKVLKQLSGNPGKAHKKAIEMGVNKFTELCLLN